MDYIDIKTAKKGKKGFLPFGTGTTANCYMMKDGRVLKLYRNTGRKYYMFYLFDGMIDHLDHLSKVSNTSYVGPEVLVMNKGECAGYTYHYRPASTLNKMEDKVKIEELLDNYEILRDDTAKISETCFSLKDLHIGNMLYDGHFYIIDLDMGHFNHKDKKEVFNNNMNQINETIIYGIFGLESYYKMHFKDDDLQKLYRECTLHDYKQISELLKEISTYRKKIDTVGDAKSQMNRLLVFEDRNYY